MNFKNIEDETQGKSLKKWKNVTNRVASFLLEKIVENAIVKDDKVYVEPTDENQNAILALSQIAKKEYLNIIDYLLDTNPTGFDFDLRKIEITKIEEWFIDENSWSSCF